MGFKLKLAAISVVILLFASGCGVVASPEYSQLIDRTAALSAETAQRAQADELSEAQMTEALIQQAITWRLIKDAKEGKANKYDDLDDLDGLNTE